MDPRNKDIELDSLMYGKITQLTEEEMKRQEGEYIYHYRYNGGGASQVWLGMGRYSERSSYRKHLVLKIFFQRGINYVTMPSYSLENIVCCQKT